MVSAGWSPSIAGVVETRNRQGVKRDWLRGDVFELGLRRLAANLPILWDGPIATAHGPAGPRSRDRSWYEREARRFDER
jgi:hypothetical protein